MSIEYVYSEEDLWVLAFKEHAADMFPCGSGLYSKVYTNREIDHVVKIMRGHDMGYRAYAASVKGADSPYFPKIFREIRYCQPGLEHKPYCIVFYIEKLEPVFHRKSATAFAAALEKAVYEVTSVNPDLSKYSPKHQRLLIHLSNILKNTESIFVDIHEFNIMQRGREYVVIDPFCFDNH